MALAQSQPPASKKVCDITNLMSPPEPPKFESFVHDGINHTAAANNHRNNSTHNTDNGGMSKATDSSMSAKRRVQAAVPPLSPPISPATQLDDHAMNVELSAKDPILYPSHEGASSPTHQSLFMQEDVTDTKRTVDGHVLARPAELFKDATPPEQEDYELALHFRSQIMKLYLENPNAWLKRERALLIADRRAQARHRQFKLQPILPAKPQAIRREVQRAKSVRTPRVTKPTPTKQSPTRQAHASSASAKPRPIRAGPGPSAAAAAASGGISAGLAKPAARGSSATPDPSPRRATQTRIDDDFNSVPDYCPPKESLTRNFNSLKMDFKTAANDLSNDPNRHLLHPEELVLASNLRLSCAVYLTSKRRIFLKRLECLRHPKEFRKTDAQQACNIDVNKASKLWTAFDMVGWLDPAWVKKYL
ncbi:SWIRM domain-containing protein [Xylaria intraflava]|nr:SWIRM domain-containing protein [Xylaria intraflava]